MKDGLTQYIDLQNSFYSTRRTWAHNAFVNLQYSILENNNEKLWLYVRFPMRMATEKLDYQRERTDTLLRRHLNFFEPDLKLKYYPKAENRDIFFILNYRLTHSAPDLSYNINYRDDATPW